MVKGQSSASDIIQGPPWQPAQPAQPRRRRAAGRNGMSWLVMIFKYSFSESHSHSYSYS